MVDEGRERTPGTIFWSAASIDLSSKIFNCTNQLTVKCTTRVEPIDEPRHEISIKN